MYKSDSVTDTYLYWKLKDFSHSIEGFCQREFGADKDFAEKLSEAVKIIEELAVDYSRRYMGEE